MIPKLKSRLGIEIWKTIPEYENEYQVSNLGNVKSLNYRMTGKPKNLILSPNSMGRLNVNLSKEGIKKNYQIHCLVAISFLNHKPNGYKIVVDHIDNNPINNHLYNLQLITQRENSSKDKNNPNKYTGVFKSNKGFKSVIYLNGKSKYLGTFRTAKEAHKAYKNQLSKIQ
jgi:hypothetical protein